MLSNQRKSAFSRRRLRTVVEDAGALEPSAPYVFLTLTARNRPWAELGLMLDELAEAEARFWRLDAVKRAFIGSITSHEIVCRGTKDNPEAGAHSHVLIACHPEYFDLHAPEPRYLSQARLTDLFQQSLRSDYKPILYIERVRADAMRPGHHDLGAALRELVKYCAKPSSLFTSGTRGLIADPSTIAVLSRALHRRRMLRVAGIFAKASRIHNKASEGGHRADLNPHDHTT